MNDRPAEEVDSSIEATRSFDAFISYNRDDIEFARALEKALQNFRPPKGIGHDRRRLRVFRDESDLVGTRYFKAISEFIQRSQKLIVVCTPSARGSGYVDDEIERFAKAQGAQNIVPVLYRGRPNSEFKPGEEDDRAFPVKLEELMQEPLATDYRAYDSKGTKPDQGQFRNSWYTLLANLLDVGREDIEQRVFRRQRRDRIIVATIVSVVIASLATFGTIARIQKLRADEQRNLALSGLAVNLAAKSNQLAAQQPDMGALLAVEAVTVTDEAERTPVPEAQQALRDALAATVGNRLPDAPDRSLAAGFSDDGHFVYSASAREIRTWSMPPGQASFTSTLSWSTAVADDASSSVATSKNERWMAVVTADRTSAIDVQNPGDAVTVDAEAAADIRSVRVSNDGRWVLARTNSQALYLLDLRDGDTWQTLIEPPGEENRYRQRIRRFGFGPGANRVHAADSEGVLRFWSSGSELVDTGLALGESELDQIVGGGRAKAVMGRLAVSQDSQLLAIAGVGQPLVVYAFDDDAAVPATPHSSNDMVAASVGFGPGTRTLLAQTDDGNIVIWRADELDNEPIVLEAELGSGTSIYRMSPDEKLLAVAADDALYIWNLERPNRRANEFDERPDDLLFTPDSRRMVLIGGRIVTVRNLEYDDEVSALALRYASNIRRLRVSADSRWLLSADRSTLRLTDLDNPYGGTRAIHVVPREPELETDVSRTGPGFDARSVMSGTPSSGLPGAGAFSADGRWFATIGALENVLVADLSRPHDAPRSLTGIEDATAVAFDPTSRWLVTGNADESVLAWSMTDLAAPPLALERTEIDGDSSIARLVFSPDGRWLAAGAGLGEISLWDWRNVLDAQPGGDETVAGAANQAIALGGHEGWVLSLDFAADSSLLVTAGERATQVWAPASLDAPVARFEIPLGHSQARLVPGRRAVVAGGADGIVRIWNIDTPDVPAVELRGHDASIINIAVQSEGQLLATASDDGQVLIWQLDQPDSGLLRELQTRRTNGIDFVSSGQLVTSGFEWTALWNLSDLSEDPVLLPGSGRGGSYWMAVSENEDAVGTITQEGVARIWPLGQDKLIEIACQLANSNLEYSLWRDAYGDLPYEKTCVELPSHVSLVDTGKTMARAGDVEEATELLMRAVELDPNLDIDPRQLVTSIAVEAMLDRGKRLAKAGKVIAASVQFERAKALKDDAVADPKVYADQLASAQLHLKHGEKMARGGRYDAAVAAYITARGLDPDIDIDPVAQSAQHVASHYRSAGRSAARNLNIDRAIEQYRKAAVYDPESTLDPVTEASRHAAREYQDSAERAAVRGDIESAMELYVKALALDPTLDVDPQVATHRLAAPFMARRAIDELRHGRIDSGMAQFQNALQANPDMEITAECWNQMCWHAVLWQRHDAVSDACGRAVEMDPDNASFRDTRGVFRAVTGQLSLSAADFEAYVEAFENERGREDEVTLRREWLTVLGTGRNPLTEAELVKLRPADNVISLLRCAR